MPEKFNISSLFDQSGNLTLNAMERYLRNELSAADRIKVEEHLAKSEFDREALEGLKNHGSVNISQEVKDLNSDILFAARKKAGKSGSVISRRTYWVAAAGLAGLIGLSVLMFFMFRSTAEKPQLAVAQPDTIINNPGSATGIRENSSITEKENVPVTEQKREFNSKVNPSPQRSSGIEKITPEPNQPVTQIEVADYSQSGIINDDIPVVVEADEVTEFQIVGGVAITDDQNAVEENLNRKGERVTTNYEIQAQSAKVANEDAMPEQQYESMIFMVVEQMPEFPGEEKAWYRFLEENIHYPDSARLAGIQGNVYVTFVVNKDGSVSDARVLRGIGGGCDEEALRVVKSMPNWIPGKQRGKPVCVQYNLPIKFSLE
jgi:TonB family protein